MSCDLGILFHAREFPKEYRASRYQDVTPVGDPKMGGIHDMRWGTECSIEDGDSHLRNYVWLLSTNRVVILDCSHPVLTNLVQDREFWTVPVSHFANVGDINVTYNFT